MCPNQGGSPGQGALKNQPADARAGVRMKKKGPRSAERAEVQKSHLFARGFTRISGKEKTLRSGMSEKKGPD